jgi:hypothetical protein
VNFLTELPDPNRSSAPASICERTALAAKLKAGLEHTRSRIDAPRSVPAASFNAERATNQAQTLRRWVPVQDHRDWRALRLLR